MRTYGTISWERATLVEKSFTIQSVKLYLTEKGSLKKWAEEVGSKQQTEMIKFARSTNSVTNPADRKFTCWPWKTLSSISKKDELIEKAVSDKLINCKQNLNWLVRLEQRLGNSAANKRILWKLTIVLQKGDQQAPASFKQRVQLNVIPNCPRWIFHPSVKITLTDKLPWKIRCCSAWKPKPTSSWKLNNLQLSLGGDSQDLVKIVAITDVNNDFSKRFASKCSFQSYFVWHIIESWWRSRPGETL